MISNPEWGGDVWVRGMFQSLNWDGVISNQSARQWQLWYQNVSIPQLGWGDFKLCLGNYVILNRDVSIPQLGWGDFKRGAR